MSFSKSKEQRHTLQPVKELEKTPQLHIKVAPSHNKPKEWVVILIVREYSIEKENTKTHEIAKIDNSHNQKPHIHRYFEQEDPPKEYLPLQNYQEAIEYLKENYKEFTKKYFLN
jgi:hypothetical protein